MDAWTLDRLFFLVIVERKTSVDHLLLLELVITFTGLGLLTDGLRRDTRHDGRIHTARRFGSFHP